MQKKNKLMLTYWNESVFLLQSKIAPTAIGTTCVYLESTQKYGKFSVFSSSTTWEKEKWKKLNGEEKGEGRERQTNSLWSESSICFS